MIADQIRSGYWNTEEPAFNEANRGYEFFNYGRVNRFEINLSMRGFWIVDLICRFVGLMKHSVQEHWQES